MEDQTEKPKNRPQWHWYALAGGLGTLLALVVLSWILWTPGRQASTPVATVANQPAGESPRPNGSGASDQMAPAQKVTARTGTGESEASEEKETTKNPN